MAALQRWTTFDCYGTLIDLNCGIRRTLARVFGETKADEALRCYHEIEPDLQADGRLSYRAVMTEGMRRLGADESQVSSLAESLAEWPVFPEVPAALDALRARGWRLAILSNTDPDLLAVSIRRIGVPIDVTVVASEIGSYKPAPRHWESFFTRSSASAAHHVHVAASLFHDIAPAAALGLRAIWINRLGEQSPLPRAGELPDLSELPATLAALERHEGDKESVS
jgi:2-haloalkanoic acid dehalogenase type II